MTNKLGNIFTGPSGKCIVQEAEACSKCGEDVYLVYECPDRLKDAPDGFIVYIDRDGALQVMEEDPHDYR